MRQAVQQASAAADAHALAAAFAEKQAAAVFAPNCPQKPAGDSEERQRRPSRMSAPPVQHHVREPSRGWLLEWRRGRRYHAGLVSACINRLLADVNTTSRSSASSIQSKYPNFKFDSRVVAQNDRLATSATPLHSRSICC